MLWASIPIPPWLLFSQVPQYIQFLLSCPTSVLREDSTDYVTGTALPNQAAPCPPGELSFAYPDN